MFVAINKLRLAIIPILFLFNTICFLRREYVIAVR